jgi:hypothetical protein
MTKKEIKNAFNKQVYMFAESLGYIIEDNGDGSCVTFIKPEETNGYNSIDYHRSYQCVYVVNWTIDSVKADAEKIEAFIAEQKIVMGC